jgi:hypothetical protein
MFETQTDHPLAQALYSTFFLHESQNFAHSMAGNYIVSNWTTSPGLVSIVKLKAGSHRTTILRDTFL